MPGKKKKAVVKKKVVKKKLVRKGVVRKKIKRGATKVTPKQKVGKQKENVVGVVTHYFPHVMAAVVKLKAPLAVGENIKIKGHTTDFTQNITSMQIDHLSVNEAKKGTEIGLLVTSRVRQHDLVCKV